MPVQGSELGSEYYIGSGPSDIYPRYTEIIKLNCPITKLYAMNGSIGIELDGAVTLEIELNGRTYN